MIKWSHTEKNGSMGTDYYIDLGMYYIHVDSSDGQHIYYVEIEDFMQFNKQSRVYKDKEKCKLAALSYLGKVLLKILKINKKESKDINNILDELKSCIRLN